MEIFCEQRPIFFPITATVPGKWPICLSRRTGHAQLAGMTGGEEGDQEGGVCTDADAPSGDMELNSLIDGVSLLFLLVSITKLSMTKIQNKSLAHCKSKNSWWGWKQRHTCTEVSYVLFLYSSFFLLLPLFVSACTRPTAEFLF